MTTPIPILSMRLLLVSILATLLPGAESSGAPGPLPPMAPAPTSAPALVWDAMEKTLNPKAGDPAVQFEFSVTNRADRPVEILELRPSCGCTMAEMPVKPWVLAPGATGSFRAVVDLTGKQGKISKVIHVISSAGTQMLGLVINLPEDPGANRRQNNQVAALNNRQAVLQGTCASCHVAPIGDKTGADLFHVACGICHSASPRAAMVPDLLIAREPRDEAYWRKWITEGREASLMPAFAQSKGGPLTDAQIESLIAFALDRLPREPVKP